MLFAYRWTNHKLWLAISRTKNNCFFVKSRIKSINQSIYCVRSDIDVVERADELIALTFRFDDFDVKAFALTVLFVLLNRFRVNRKKKNSKNKITLLEQERTDLETQHLCMSTSKHTLKQYQQPHKSSSAAIQSNYLCTILTTDSGERWRHNAKVERDKHNTSILFESSSIYYYYFIQHSNNQTNTKKYFIIAEFDRSPVTTVDVSEWHTTRRKLALCYEVIVNEFNND